MEQKVTIELNIQHLNTILSGLAKLPIEIGLDTFNYVQQIANSQLNQQPITGKDK